MRIDNKKLREFYPEGLKKGFILETDEFNRWDFIEKPRLHIDSYQKKFYFDMNQYEWRMLLIEYFKDFLFKYNIT
ncbi:MAG: hypothetical protein WCL00_13070 [Bacteroidota bacterium]